MFEYGNVTIMAKDMDRSVAFYTELLGLKLKNRYGNHWAEVEIPGITIGLHPAMSISSPERTKDISIGFSVRDLDSALQKLSSKGIACDAVRDGPDNRIA